MGKDKQEKTPLEKKMYEHKNSCILNIICSIIWLIAGILNLFSNTSVTICIIDFVLVILWGVIGFLNYKSYIHCKKEFNKNN